MSAREAPAAGPAPGRDTTSSPPANAAAHPGCVLCEREPSAWTLHAPRRTAEHTGTFETLMTLSNGYLATRGAAPEHAADGIHYPGTYVAGTYNRLTSRIDGTPREDESIVNLPNWLPISLRAAGSDLIVSPDATVEHDHWMLDMRHALLHRETHVAHAAGRRTAVLQQRWVSLRDPHLAYLRASVVPLDWSGALEIGSWIAGDVINDNVVAFRGLAARHLSILHADVLPEGSGLIVAETTQSRIRVAVAARTAVPASAATGAAPSPIRPGHTWTVPVSPGSPVVVDKTAAVFTSRDHAISEPSAAALRELAHAAPFGAARRAHATEWEHVWQRMRFTIDVDARIEGSLAVQRAVNLHLFHVAQTLSRHSADADVGVPARGLHGEGYRGRVFWDELFVYPLLNLRVPQVTRAMLMYRYRRLPEARRLARSIGEAGALFPWQSGSDGREETPVSFFNPLSQAWMPDHSARQFHVGLAIAYSTWHYFQVTGDVNFLASFGAELLVEVARFWASRAEYDPRTERYHLRGMMGPDEFHDGPPTEAGAGIDDNAYVAVMTSWLMTTVLRAHRVLGGDDTEVWQRLGVDASEREHWSRLSRRLHVPFLSDGLIAQFDGYEQLEELDIAAYRARYGDDVGRLDLVLSAEGDTTNRYRVSKQADVLMLFYLFSAEELTAVFDRLGYDFDPASIPVTIEYYRQRTTHGSTLSCVVHAWVLARGDRRASWLLLREGFDTDLTDLQRGTTREGIHLGAMAATADILQRCFTGLEIRDDTVFLHPQLPDAIERLSFDVRYRGHWLTLTVTHRRLHLASREGAAAPIRVVIDGHAHTVECGGSVTTRLASPPR